MTRPESKPLRCFFIDDAKPLETPEALKDEVCDWTVFRSLREFRTSEVFKTQPADVVVFDYYLNGNGTQTGRDAIEILVSRYTAEGWVLPRAAFNSSDSECNDRMRKQWLSYGGQLLSPMAPVASASATPIRKTSGVAAHFRRNKTKGRG